MNEKLNIAHFLPGDKVVVTKVENEGLILPKLNKEIVTIKSKCLCGDCDHYYIDEYPFDFYGRRQSFHYTHLRKVQESKFRAVSFEKVMEETEIICEN